MIGLSLTKLFLNHIIDFAFDIIHLCFDRSYKNWVDKDGEVHHYPAKDYTPVFEFVREYFKKTRIMLPDGTILRKMHGIPSGSMFTQAIGCIANYVMITSLCLYFDIPIVDLCVLGDDSHFRVDESVKVPVSDIAHVAKLYFGMILSPEKVNIYPESGVRKFLGYTFNGTKPIRPMIEWFRRVLYPERAVQNLGVSASRVLGLLLIGGVNDEVYCDFCLYYFRVYPQVAGRAYYASSEISRAMRYVFHHSFKMVRIPHMNELKWINLPNHLSLDLPVTG